MQARHGLQYYVAEPQSGCSACLRTQMRDPCGYGCGRRSSESAAGSENRQRECVGLLPEDELHKMR